MQKLLVSIILFFISLPLKAVIIEDLYTAEVPLINKSEAEIEKAMQSACKIVLKKVTNIEIKPDNNTLHNWIRNYSFLTREGDIGDLSIRFEFDKREVANFLRRENLPMWSENRPLLIIWLATIENNKKQLLTDSPNNINIDLFSKFKNGFAEFAIPIIFPVMDLYEEAQIDLEKFGQGDFNIAVELSKRYEADSVLAGTVLKLPDGRWVANWELITDKEQIKNRTQAFSIDEITLNMSSKVADSLIKYYASNFNLLEEVTLLISGINNFSDYTKAVNYFKQLNDVKDVMVKSVNGKYLTLDIKIQGGKSSLEQTLKLDELLSSFTLLNSSENTLVLEFRP